MTVAEKIRKRAAKIRRAEKMGLSGYDMVSEVQSVEERDVNDREY